MVALSAHRLVWPATSWISLTTSPIFCAACASPPICSLVAAASRTAMLTRLLVWPSCWLISPIEADSSSAADAALSTFIDALLDSRTAPSARSEFLLEAANSVVAVERIAMALSPTVRSSASTRARKPVSAASMPLRRCSWAAIRSRSCSARSCLVTSWWVETQPPSAMGRLEMA